MRRLLLIGIALLLVSLIWSSGCADPDVEEVEAIEEVNDVEEKGTIMVGWAQEPDTLNPLTTYYIQGFIVARTMLYDTLISYDENLDYIPWLAGSWEVSEDGTSWEFDLVDEVYWHDGETLTAEDVKFTVEFIQDAEIPGAMALVDNIESVEIIDETNLKFHLYQADALTKENMANLWIVPKHIFQDVPLDEAVLFDNEPPVGSGPFEFVSWDRGDIMVFEANENYWRDATQSEGVIFKLFPSVETMVLALQRGEIDIIGQEVPVHAVDGLEEDENIEVLVEPGTYFKEVSINVSDFGKQNPALKDQAVRQAMLKSIDKERLVDLIHLGYAEPAVSIVPPALGEWFNEDIVPYEFNLDKAANKLDEAGYTDRNDDGIRESEDGTRLEIELQVLDRWPEEMRAAELISDWWEEIGIKVTLGSMDGDTICSLIYPDYEQDMFLWGYESRADPDFILGIMTTNQIQNFNDCGYSNPEYDELFKQQRLEADPEARREIVWEMQEMIYEESPYIVLYYMDAIGAYRADVLEGVHPSIGGMISQFNPEALRPISKEK